MSSKTKTSSQRPGQPVPTGAILLIAGGVLLLGLVAVAGLQGTGGGKP